MSVCLQHIPNMVVGIQTFGDRIVVSDVQESVHFVKYRPAENQLVIFADDTTQTPWYMPDSLQFHDQASAPAGTTLGRSLEGPPH